MSTEETAGQRAELQREVCSRFSIGFVHCKQLTFHLSSGTHTTGEDLLVNHKLLLLFHSSWD